MAHSKFIKVIALFGCILCNTNYANPSSEFVEMRAAQRSESPRVQRMATPTKQVPPPQPLPQREESCCWSFLSCFCGLMQYAGNSAPHPMIRMSEQRRAQ